MKVVPFFFRFDKAARSVGESRPFIFLFYHRTPGLSRFFGISPALGNRQTAKYFLGVFAGILRHIFLHGAEYFPASLFGFYRIIGIHARRLRKTGETNCLRQGKFRRRYAVIIFGGGLDSVLIIPKINDIQVKRQDFFFGIAFFQFKSDKGLGNLAGHLFFLCKIKIPRQLLRNRTSAADDFAMLIIAIFAVA